MPSHEHDLITGLDKNSFVGEFIDVFTRNGYGALPKREIELLVLHLLQRHNKELPTDYILARALKISPKRLQNMLDELSYRDEEKTDEWCKEKIKEILRNAEKIKDGTWVKFQVDDGLLRDFVYAKVRSSFGIVDTSFNSSIVKISGEQFGALILELTDEKERRSILDQISSAEKNRQQNKEKSKTPIRLFIDAFAKKAGETAGKKSVDLGFAILTGGASEIKEIINSIFSK